MYFFEHNLSIIGCLVSIIVVLTSTGFRPSAGRNVFLTRFSLFRRAMNRTSWALQVCAEVCTCDRTPLRERLVYYNETCQNKKTKLLDTVACNDIYKKICTEIT